MLIALLALVAGAGIVMLLKPGGKDTPSILSPASSPPPNTLPEKEQANISKQGQVSVESESRDNRNLDVPPLTVEGVNALITRWKNAQNSGDFPDYQSCYGHAFEGILRTASDQRRVYNFNGWMRDRKRMFSQTGGLNLDVKNLRIRIEGDTAVVEFDQYYHSLSYSDWGPKVIRAKMSPTGEKIVYEELKASYPL